MFTEDAQAVVDLAKDYAFAAGSAKLDLVYLLAAMGGHAEGGILLAECLGLSVEALRAVCPQFTSLAACPGSLPVSEAMRPVLAAARDLSEEVPNRLRPALADLRHLACALAMSGEACTVLDVAPIVWENATELLRSWCEQEENSPRLDRLTERLRGLRAELLGKVFGQDHAIQAFAEGLFNAEVVAGADRKRRSPRVLFVFAGPPGVGKTYLAELGASYLNRPFRRFDMSSYAGHLGGEMLVGRPKSYMGAQPGTLTGFVDENPGAVLLFDEIEKASTETIHLFLQVLDAGVLEDRYHERNVSFREATIIFTTNAGRKLYDRPNASGVHAANAAFHRKTILDALANEKDPRTQGAGAEEFDLGRPLFPPAICSRLAAGYPVLFNHLRVTDLERVVRAELTRVGNLLERQYYMQVRYDDLLPICLVLREGARADARNLRSQAETFVKTELFNFCQLFRSERLEQVLGDIDRMCFVLDEGVHRLSPEVRAMLEPPGAPRVLLIADGDLADLFTRHVLGIDWRTASTAENALAAMAEAETDMVLLDLWIGQGAAGSTATIRSFDHVPAAARGLDEGQELLRRVRDRMPNMPVYLLSFGAPGEQADPRRSIDEELFMACVRGGGARGLMTTRFVDAASDGWEDHRDRLAADLVETCRSLYREAVADRMAQEHRVLAFETVPQLDRQHRQVGIRLRNLQMTRAVSAADAVEVLDEVERPAVRFDDVVGARAAKEELKFFVDYLSDPRRFLALGLEPPKGVLLHGPSGTGKTMLARAMAGESAVAFIPTVATSFVTIWQGSGPQHVRDLFARARRYAPAIVFIDEIDAIGRTRSGLAGGGRAEENSLNALLAEIDGFTSHAPDRPVFVLAATNFRVALDGEESPQVSERALDPALVRRFTRAIKLDLPTRADRQEYLTRRLGRRRECPVAPAPIQAVADRSPGMSFSDLARIVDLANRLAVKAGAELTGEMLEEAFESICHGEARPRTAEELRRAACHEAGHVVLYWLSGWWPSYVTVVSRGDHGGYMSKSADETEKGSCSREEVLARIRVSLAGRAAEMICYGHDAGTTTGAVSDLEHASSWARQMVCRYGMDSTFGLLVMPELMRLKEAQASPVLLKVNKAASSILAEQMSKTMRLLSANRRHLDAVIDALVDRERLSREDLRSILPETSSPPAEP